MVTSASNLIFLDVDGVLNNANTRRAILTSMDPFCMERKLVKVLDKLVVKTRASIVLSSSWRCYMTLPDFREKLIAFGSTAAFQKVIGATEDLFRVKASAERHHEVAAWLDERRSGWRAERGGVVVLDDCEVMKGFEERQVMVDRHTGLTEDDASMAAAILRGDMP